MITLLQIVRCYLRGWILRWRVNRLNADVIAWQEDVNRWIEIVRSYIAEEEKDEMDSR